MFLWRSARIFSLLRSAFALSLLAWTTLATSQDMEDKNRELTEIQRRIQSAQRSVGGLEQQKSTLSEQLEKLDVEYGKLSTATHDLETQSKLAEQEIEKLKRRKATIASTVLRQNKALTGQARAAYALGEKEWLKTMLNQESGEGASRVLTYYRYLNLARLTQLKALEKDLTEARSLESTSQTLLHKLDTDRESLRSETSRLDQIRAQRQQSISQIDRQTRDKTKEIMRLQEDAQRLQNLLTKLQKSSPPTPPPSAPGEVSQPASPSHAGLPVSGELRQHFGAPRMSGQWDGVVIASAEGQPVRAVRAGRVAFADWLRGYGLLAIVDHGNGLMSLYGFNQSIHKTVGDWVNAGDVVASVGSSGGQSEPALYFGLRDKGRPIDPMAWRNREN